MRQPKKSEQIKSGALFFAINWKARCRSTTPLKFKTIEFKRWHSKGLQSVRVKTRRGYVVLASDATHLYQHIDEGRVFPITYNVGDVLAIRSQLLVPAARRRCLWSYAGTSRVTA